MLMLSSWRNQRLTSWKGSLLLRSEVKLKNDISLLDSLQFPILCGIQASENKFYDPFGQVVFVGRICFGTGGLGLEQQPFSTCPRIRLQYPYADLTMQNPRIPGPVTSKNVCNTPQTLRRPRLIPVQQFRIYPKRSLIIPHKHLSQDCRNIDLYIRRRAIECCPWAAE